MSFPIRNAHTALMLAISLCTAVAVPHAWAYHLAAGGHASHGGGGGGHYHSSGGHYYYHSGHHGYGYGYRNYDDDWDPDGGGYGAPPGRDDLNPPYYPPHTPVFVPMQGDPDLGTVNYGADGVAKPVLIEARESEAELRRQEDELARQGVPPHAVAPVPQRPGYYQGGLREFGGSAAYGNTQYAPAAQPGYARASAAMSPDVQQAQMQIVRSQLDMARSFAASGNASQAARTYGMAIDALRRIPGQDAALREALTARSSLLRELGNTSGADALMQQAGMH